MLIDEQNLLHWLRNFYGYGSWDAKAWLIQFEESGGEVPEEVAEKINYFRKNNGDATETLCDIRDLYSYVSVPFDGAKAELFTNRYEFRFGQNAVLHGVWKNLIAFTHGYNSAALPDQLDYQKKSFASPLLRREALISLYPLPGPHSHAWYYSWLDLPNMPYLKNRQSYEEQVYAGRMQTILNKLSTHRPDVVLMYGMNNIQTLKKSVQDFFSGVRFRMVKAVKQQIPQHHRAEINGTTLLITTQIPALRHGRVETGFDWEYFGRIAGNP